MRFTDGFWLMRPGVEAHYARDAYDLVAADEALVVTAPTKVIAGRGDTLNLPVLTVTVAPHLPGVVRVRIEHHTGGGAPLRFETSPAAGGSHWLQSPAWSSFSAGRMLQESPRSRISPTAPASSHLAVMPPSTGMVTPVM